MMHLGDREIRAHLLSSFRKTAPSKSKGILVEELDLAQGETRADIAIINGSLTGIEIKSDNDTLERLTRQIEVYNQFFDKIIICSGNKHLGQIQKTVPNWWGIRLFSFDGNVKSKTIRVPKRNPRQDTKSLVQLLWREEALELLHKHNKDQGLKSKPRHILWDAIIASLPEKKIRAFVITQLKSRKNWRLEPPQMSDGD